MPDLAISMVDAQAWGIEGEVFDGQGVPPYLEHFYPGKTDAARVSLLDFRGVSTV